MSHTPFSVHSLLPAYRVVMMDSSIKSPKSQEVTLTAVNVPCLAVSFSAKLSSNSGGTGPEGGEVSVQGVLTEEAPW